MRIGLLLGSILIIQGCASLFSEHTDKISIKTDPPGAKVYLDGDYLGHSPIEFEVEKSTFGSHDVSLRIRGYNSKDFKLTKKLSNLAIYNLTGLPSWATDATTGNMIEYQPKKYYVELVPRGARGGAIHYKNLGLLFALTNHQNILNDVAKGEGEYLRNFAKALNIEDYKMFRDTLKENFEKLPQRDPVLFFQNIQINFL